MKSELLNLKARDIDTGFNGLITGHTLRADETEWVEITAKVRKGRNPQAIWVELDYVKVYPKSKPRAKR